MALNFNELRANADQSFAVLQQKMEEAKTSYTKDERFWYPSADKDGNGSALIRWLPAAKGETIPFVRLYSRSFKLNGRSYHENDLSTLGQKDPVGELCSELWNSSSDTKDDAHELARLMGRKTTYITNILVLSDPFAPENEGKNFLYNAGKKVWAKIEGAMNPKFADQQKFNPFSPWEGANFRIRVCTVANFRNYDQSQFDQVGKLANDDAMIEKIWAKEYPLLPFVDPSQFRPYDELKAQLDSVIGNKADILLHRTASVSVPASYHAPASASVPAPAPVEHSATQDDDQPDSVDEFLKSLNR